MVYYMVDNNQSIIVQKLLMLPFKRLFPDDILDCDLCSKAEYFSLPSILALCIISILS